MLRRPSVNLLSVEEILMAQRRMIDKRTIQTQKFLRLPLETQALYFHLILNADDDGVVEAFPIVRMVGAAEDSLGLLVVKQFIKPLNDEMVYFIIDFKEQNTIKKDRYKASKYADLLASEVIGTDMEPKRNQIGTSDKSRLDKKRLEENREEYIVKENFIFPDYLSEKAIEEVKKGNQENYSFRIPIAYLNQVTGKNYRHVPKNINLVKARYNEGFLLEDFKKVIDIKFAEWGKDTEMNKYLRPETLFGTKFDGYLNQKPLPKGKNVFADPNAKFDVNDRGGW